MRVPEEFLRDAICCEECGGLGIASVAFASHGQSYRPFQWSSRWVHKEPRSGRCRRVDVCSQCLYRMNHPKPSQGYHENAGLLSEKNGCAECAAEHASELRNA